MEDGVSAEELRRRGLELQAAIPEPSGAAKNWHRGKDERREGIEIAYGAADLGAGFGLLGLVLVVPGVAIWALRRLRRWLDQTQ